MAKDSMQRVGLIFDEQGSATLMKSLKLVNSELQRNYNDFKLTQAQWDESTKTSQKLTEKLSYLNNAYDVQSKKVEILKKQVEELENAENKDEVAIQKKKSALAAAETSLQRYQNQINSVSKELKNGLVDLKDYAKKIEDTGVKITEAGKKMSVASAAIAGVGTASVAAFKEVDEGADTAIKATGLVGEEAKKLENSYKDVASSVTGDFNDIGAALGEVQTRFGFTGTELEETTKLFMKFSNVTGTDATAAVQKVSRYMGDASIPSSELGNVLDSLTSAAQASGISIDSLTEMCTKYGAPMRALGLTTQESIAMFASWEKAGVNTEIAFSGMKKAISNWGAAGKDAKEEFKKTLDEIAATPSIADATSKAIEIFGAKAGPDLADAIKNGRFEYTDMLNVLENSNGILENTYNEIFDGSDQADLAFKNMKIALSEVGSSIMTSLAPAFEKLADFLKGVAEWWSGLSPEAQNTILVIAGIVAAIGPLLIIIGQVAAGVSALLPLFGAIGGVITGISAPVLGIVAAVAAVIAIIVLCIKHWDTIKEVTLNVIDNITSCLSNFWNSAVEGAKGAWNSIVQVFSNVANFFGSIFSKAWENVKNVFSVGGKIFDGIKDGIAAAFKSIVNTLIAGINRVVAIPFNAINKALNTIKNVKIMNLRPFAGLFGTISVPQIPALMAKGGELLSGSAIVAEAGPELLMQQGNKTKVLPLTNGGGATPTQLIDYNKLANTIVKSLNSCKFTLDEDGFVGIVKDELLKVM